MDLFLSLSIQCEGFTCKLKRQDEGFTCKLKLNQHFSYTYLIIMSTYLQ